jgi:hypothetical protein
VSPSVCVEPELPNIFPDTLTRRQLDGTLYVVGDMAASSA